MNVVELHVNEHGYIPSEITGRAEYKCKLVCFYQFFWGNINPISNRICNYECS